MYFAHDTDFALRSATALVNTSARGRERLVDVAALDEFFVEFEWTGLRERTETELEAVRSLRPLLRSVWEAADAEAAVEVVNDLLRRTNARPWLTRHGTWDWHLHVTESADPLVDRMGAEAAMAFADVIRVGDLDRLKFCAAPDCDAVLIDLSRNRSRLFCDIGNCGNKANVAAYRARKARAAQ